MAIRCSRFVDVIHYQVSSVLTSPFCFATTGKPDIEVTEDEEYHKVKFDKVKDLKAVFEKNGKMLLL